jgi:hypothetical protein
MDATIRTPSRATRRPAFPIVVIVSVSLLIGGAAGSLATNFLSRADARPVVADATWDPQKLAAMAGRQLSTATVAPSAPWDPQKLEAMAGRQLAG